MKILVCIKHVPDTETKIMACGQSLGPMLNLRLARPDRLVAVTRIDAMRAIGATDDYVKVGAAPRHAADVDVVVFGRFVNVRCEEFLLWVASRVVYQDVDPAPPVLRL